MACRCMFLFWMVSASLASGQDVSAVANEASPRRPNIVFCFADDWGRYASAYGKIDTRPCPSQVVKTPNIDGIAQRGVLFRNAFVNAPSCTPCRSSLLSGRYFFRTGRGAILQGAEWDSSIPSFPLLLRDAGYHIGETYKVWSPGTPNDAPFGAGKYAYEKAGGAFNNFSENVTKLVAEGVSFDTASERMYANVRGNFDAFLAARPKEQPFCYWFGPTNVHRQWVKGSGKALWGIDPDSLKGKLPKFLPDVPEIREDFADYLGEIQAYDAGVGVLLKKLDEIGERDNTLIVISGDHGAPGFPGGKCNLYDFGVGVSLVASWPGQPGGRVVDDFVNLMDLAPTFLEAGGAKLPEGMNGRSLVPLLKSTKSGLVDPSRTWVVTGRERHVAAARDGNLPYPQRALRTADFLLVTNIEPDRWPMGSPIQVTETDAPSAQVLENDTFAAFADMDASPTKAWLIAHRHDPAWKQAYHYSFGKRPAIELYDLKQDPDQIMNVADENKYAETKLDLVTRLSRLLKDVGDPGSVGDGKMFERPPFVDANGVGASKKR
ncbi:MAG: betC 1 [Schlesneria sp.]|nr:betC 1 [Schlesneria sp.]